MAEKIPSAKLDLEKGEIELRDETGTAITEATDDKTMLQKAGDAAKFMIGITPMGMTYSMGKHIMNKGMEMLDRTVNENELNQVQNIDFEDIVRLVEEGKDRFDELEMTFTTSQSNGFSIQKLRERFGKDVSLDMGKRGDVGLELKVKYKS
jgi:reverse gyrase